MVPYGRGELRTAILSCYLTSYDSIIPCLALRGVAAGIARSSSLRAKILLRELLIPFAETEFTPAPSEYEERPRDRWLHGSRLHSVSLSYTPSLVHVYSLICSAMVRTLNASYHTQPYGLGNANTTYPISAFITDLVYLKGSEVPVDVKLVTVSNPSKPFRLQIHVLICIVGRDWGSDVWR